MRGNSINSCINARYMPFNESYGSYGIKLLLVIKLSRYCCYVLKSARSRNLNVCIWLDRKQEGKCFRVPMQIHSYVGRQGPGVYRKNAECIFKEFAGK